MYAQLLNRDRSLPKQNRSEVSVHAHDILYTHRNVTVCTCTALAMSVPPGHGAWLVHGWCTRNILAAFSDEDRIILSHTVVATIDSTMDV